jgi:hypothetical protein
MTNVLYKTTKGYVIEVHRIRQTVEGEIVDYSLNEERQMTKLRSNDKGSFIEVRKNGKYYGRYYI